MSSTVCVTAGVNIAKPGTPPTHANAGCTITASGTITGWCSANTGSLSGTATDGLGQTYSMTMQFYGVGGALDVYGHWVRSNGQDGLIRGVVAFVPVPSPLTGFGNSCTNATATTFTFTGSLAFVGLNV